MGAEESHCLSHVLQGEPVSLCTGIKAVGGGRLGRISLLIILGSWLIRSALIGPQQVLGESALWDGEGGGGEGPAIKTATNDPEPSGGGGLPFLSCKPGQLTRQPSTWRKSPPRWVLITPSGYRWLPINKGIYALLWRCHSGYIMEDMPVCG